MALNSGCRSANQRAILLRPIHSPFLRQSKIIYASPILRGIRKFPPPPPFSLILHPFFPRNLLVISFSFFRRKFLFFNIVTSYTCFFRCVLLLLFQSKVCSISFIDIVFFQRDAFSIFLDCLSLQTSIKS